MADADPEFRWWVARCLVQGIGPHLRVVEAVDTGHALRVAESEEVRLVVCDLLLPRQGGLALVARMRADPGLAHVPVLLLAGEPLTASDRRRIATVTGVDVLAKPFNARALVGWVGRRLPGAPPSPR